MAQITPCYEQLPLSYGIHRPANGWVADRRGHIAPSQASGPQEGEVVPKGAQAAKGVGPANHVIQIRRKGRLTIAFYDINVLQPVSDT